MPTAQAAHPFPFVGAGTPQPFESLVYEIWFVTPPTDVAELSAGFPPALGASWDGSRLSLIGGAPELHYEVAQAAGEQVDEDGLASTRAFAALQRAVEARLIALHSRWPIRLALQLMDPESDAPKRSKWHSASVKAIPELLTHFAHVLDAPAHADAEFVQQLITYAEASRVKLPEAWKQWSEPGRGFFKLLVARRFEDARRVLGAYRGHRVLAWHLQSLTIALARDVDGAWARAHLQPWPQDVPWDAPLAAAWAELRPALVEGCITLAADIAIATAPIPEADELLPALVEVALDAGRDEVLSSVAFHEAFRAWGPDEQRSFLEGLDDTATRARATERAARYQKIARLLRSGPSKGIPERPAHVPAEATFNVETEQWEVGPKDSAGKRVGEWTCWWHSTGHHCATVHYTDQNHYDFVRYHPDGTYSQKRTRRNGADVYHIQKSKNPTTELALTEPLYKNIFKAKCTVEPGRENVWQYYDENDVRVDIYGKPALTPEDFARNFAGWKVPEELAALLELQANYGHKAYAGFTLASDDKSLIAATSKDETFLAALMPFAVANGTGARYAFWNRDGSDRLETMPIVIFGAEGGQFVVAEDVRALLQLLSADIEPSVSPESVGFDRKLRDGYGIGAYRNLIKERFGIDAITRPKTIVAAAQQKHQEAFVAWLKRYASAAPVASGGRSTTPRKTSKTKLDAKRFRAAYAAELGEAYDDEVPSTLEELFEGLHDPDDYGPATVATLKAALASVDRRTIELAEDPFVSQVTVYPGDLVVRAGLTVDKHVLVLGDLDVDGVIVAPPAHHILMVAGNVRCHAMSLLRAYLFVTGDVFVRDCFFGSVYGHSRVAGRIETPIYLQDDSWSNLAMDDADDKPTEANIVAKLKLDVGEPGARAKLAKMLVPGALGKNKGELSQDAEEIHELFDKIAAGENVLRV